MTQLADLQCMSLSELEALYAKTEVPVSVPQGRFHGVFLKRLDNLGSRREPARSLQRFGFEWLSWGVDFETLRWFFVQPWLQAGHFATDVGRSRWRETEAVCLHYGVSRLPHVLKDHLYDEVKPLGPDLCLGLGGVAGGPGDGDNFFFALRR